MIDIAGRRFGQLVALEPAGQKERKFYWLCRCDCGKQVIVQGKKLRTGHTRSCGHLRQDASRQRQTHGQARKGKETPEYYTWKTMLSRCRSPTSNDWEYYGGRGIRVCDRWHTFENFFADMGPRPDGHSIERVNNDGNYEPTNCKWIPKAEQARNQRPKRRRE